MADKTTEELLKEFISQALLLRIGKRAVFIIQNRVSEGRFLDGSSEGASQYSEKPFVMPFGAIKKKSVMTKILEDKYDDTHLFRAKSSGKLWVLIDKGYRWLREVSGKPSTKVDLTWTGELMRSLDVLEVDESKFEVTIGHKGDRNEKLSEYFNQSGTGRSRRIRKYLALSEEELEGFSELFDKED
jgi:hypothetical protein